MSRYLGVDVGATTIGAVVGDGEGRVHGRSERDTPAAEGAGITDAVVSVVRAACRDAGVAPGDVVAAGVGAAGPLDLDRGVAVDPPNVKAEEIDLVGPLVDLLAADVTLHNDATAAAVGERFFGPEDVENLVYCTISTGIGAGAIVDGIVLEGASGNAAEVGHFVLDPSGPDRCGCGGRGHWEGFCSGRHVPALASDLADAEGLSTSLDLASADAADIYDAAGSDPLATAVVERVGRLHAVGVANAIHAYDPAVVAVGGGVAVNNPETVVGAIREHMPRLAIPEPPTVRLATEGSDAVTMGALASALTAGTGRH